MMLGMRGLGSGVGIAIVVVACGGRSEPAASPPSASTNRICAKACAQKKTCGTVSDESGCHATCTNDERMRRLDRLRPELLDAIATCIDGATCSDAPDGRALAQKCVKDTARDFKPTEKAARACGKLDELTTRCGGTMPAKCQEKLKLLNDETLDRAVACTEDGSCKVANRCLRELKYEILD